MESFNGQGISVNKSEKINKAINLLKEASHVDEVGFQEMAKNSYHQATINIADAARRIKRHVKMRAQTVDNQVKNNPWRYIGATAGVSVLAGFFFGRRK